MSQSPTWIEALGGKPYISVEEAGSLLGVGRTLSYELARTGVIPVHRYGRLLRVPTVRMLDVIRRDGDTAEASQPPARRSY